MRNSPESNTPSHLGNRTKIAALLATVLAVCSPQKEETQPPESFTVTIKCEPDDDECLTLPEGSGVWKFGCEERDDNGVKEVSSVTLKELAELHRLMPPVEISNDTSDRPMQKISPEQSRKFEKLFGPYMGYAFTHPPFSFQIPNSGITHAQGGIEARYTDLQTEEPIEHDVMGGVNYWLARNQRFNEIGEMLFRGWDERDGEGPKKVNDFSKDPATP